MAAAAAAAVAKENKHDRAAYNKELFSNSGENVAYFSKLSQSQVWTDATMANIDRI